MAKFWILFLTLSVKKQNGKGGIQLLQNGLADLAIYGVENSCDNRILLADYLPENIDEEEVQADAILLQKWQEHIQCIEDKTPDGTPIVEMEILDNKENEEEEDLD